ncbi:MAG: morn variant repeat-containing protein [Bacteroidetes bacterium]|nr:MAG: morn variant repeat-containing protein [Bacteroidota bacterium]
MKKCLFLVFLFFAGITVADAQTIPPHRGRHIEKYPNGEKKLVGRCKKSGATGKWKSYYENGNLRELSHYHKGERTGSFTSWYESGKVKETGTYMQDKKNGEWIVLYESGKRKNVRYYDQGQAVGEWMHWYENGRVEKTESFADGLLYGPSEYFYSNGQVMRLVSYDAGRKNGYWNEYDSTGAVTLMIEYRLDVLDGNYRQWENGKQIKDYWYANGLLHGSQLDMNVKGDTVLYENYSAGKFHGIQKRYENGKCVYAAMYSDGSRNGEVNSYAVTSGVLLLREWFTMDHVDSTLARYVNGYDKYFRRYDRNGKLHGIYEEWNDNGKLLVRGTYVHGLKSGEWTVYYPEGQKKSTVTFVDGKAHGLFQRTYPNGKKILVQRFENGEAKGYAEIWDDKGRLFRRGSLMYEAILASSLIDETFVGANDEPDMPEPPRRTKQHDARNEIPVYDYVIEPPVPELPEPEIFQVAEEMPVFPGGEAGMMEFIKRNMVYPREELEADKKGTVYLSFVVEKDGSISDVKPLKEVRDAPGLSKEAIRLVKTMPRFTPAKMNGRTVRARMTIPIRFVLR